MKQGLDEQKLVIQQKGLDKISLYFDLEMETLSTMDADSLKHLYNMAKLGMQFEREMNITKRSTEMNFVRVGKMITENKDELKKYIKRTLPQYT